MWLVDIRRLPNEINPKLVTRRDLVEIYERRPVSRETGI